MSEKSQDRIVYAFIGVCFLFFLGVMIWAAQA